MLIYLWRCESVSILKKFNGIDLKQKIGLMQKYDIDS
jgi:hypothetical protein